MQYYRCKCGKREAWSSMGMAQCQGCSECNTTLATAPSYHKTPIPHDYKITYNVNTGKPHYYSCTRCSSIVSIENEESIPSYEEWKARALAAVKKLAELGVSLE